MKTTRTWFRGGRSSRHYQPHHQRQRRHQFSRAVVSSVLSLLLVVGLAGVSVVTLAAPASAAPYTKGNLFISASGGNVQERTPTGTLVQTLNSGTTAAYNTGSVFDGAGNLYVTQFDGNSVAKFDANGAFVSDFGSGYDSDPESIVIDASGNFYVGQADGTTNILKFKADGTPLASFAPEGGGRGTDWIDLASDNCTMQYTAESTTVKQFNVCTNTQSPDFATGLPGTAYAHRLLPDGTALVAVSNSVVRVNSSSTVLQTYTPAESVSTLFAMNLDPDGATFWTADLTNGGGVFHFNIATGAELGHFNVDAAALPAGISVLGELTAVPKLTLSPPTATNNVGTTHTVTANATDGGAPAVGVTVTFKVTAGPNAGVTGTATSNASGNASFTYTGSGGPGDDTIQASFVSKAGLTVNSNSVTKTWIKGGNGSPVVNAGPDVSTAPGTPVALNGSASDPDGDALTLAWTVSGSSCTITPTNTAVASITCTDPGTYTATLTASDGINPPVSDSATVTVTSFRRWIGHRRRVRWCRRLRRVSR